MSLVLANLEHDVAHVRNEVIRLRLENSVYQRFNEKKTMEIGAPEDDKKKKRGKKVVNTLTADQKYDIANVIHEDLLSEIETHRWDIL